MLSPALKCRWNSRLSASPIHRIRRIRGAFLGLGTVVGLEYDAAGHAALTMENGGTGDAGDAYTGLDRFNRLVETIWKNATGGKLVHSSYGRNASSGIVWRRDDLAHDMSASGQDNYYGYDGLQQVTRHDLGDLTPASGPPYTGIDPANRQQQEDFTFDETGNWMKYQSTTPAASWTQNRVNDTANQIDSLTGPAGVIQPAYDKPGNMTLMPKAGDWSVANHLTWDAWNRLVKLTEGTEEISYAYDALTRRTSKTGAGETRAYYYNRQWRAIEERVSGTVKAAYVWSPIDRWTMIRRKRSVTGTPDETRFVLKDYLDPVAIIDTPATVIERYGYEAFGQLRIMAPDFATLTASTCAWNFHFHAEFLDPDSGLYNYGFRYYHPQLGRWPSRDPIGERGGVNLYQFVKNYPILLVDTLGMQLYPGQPKEDVIGSPPPESGLPSGYFDDLPPVDLPPNIPPIPNVDSGGVTTSYICLKRSGYDGSSQEGPYSPSGDGSGCCVDGRCTYDCTPDSGEGGELTSIEFKFKVCGEQLLAINNQSRGNQLSAFCPDTITTTLTLYRNGTYSTDDIPFGTPPITLAPGAMP